MVPVRAQQDCVLDQNRDGNSELLALTSSMECRWYIISEISGVGGAPVAPNDSPKGTKKEENQEDGACSIKVDLMATLKKADLCNKLRKMDFRKYIFLSLSLIYIYMSVKLHRFASADFLYLLNTETLPHSHISGLLLNLLILMQLSNQLGNQSLKPYTWQYRKAFREGGNQSLKFLAHPYITPPL